MFAAFNFIISIVVAYVPKVRIHSLCAIIEQARASSLPNDKHNTKGLGFSYDRIYKYMGHAIVMLIQQIKRFK